jgi:hypothetical protein
MSPLADDDEPLCIEPELLVDPELPSMEPELPWGAPVLPFWDGVVEPPDVCAQHPSANVNVIAIKHFFMIFS